MLHALRVLSSLRLSLSASSIISFTLLAKLKFCTRMFLTVCLSWLVKGKNTFSIISPCFSTCLPNTVKPLNSGHLRVLKKLFVIKRCPLLEGSLTKIVTFGTKHFVRYSRHVRYWEVSLYNCWLVFFSCFVNSRRKKSQADETRYLIWTADWGGEHNTPRHTE